MWEAGKMGLLFVGGWCLGFQLSDEAVVADYTECAAGPEAPAPISSLAVHKNTVFAAAGHQVLRYLRGRQASFAFSALNCRTGQADPPVATEYIIRCALV